MYPRRILLYYFILTLSILAQNANGQQINVYAKRGTQIDTLTLNSDENILIGIARHYQLKAYFQARVDSLIKTAPRSYSCTIASGPLAGPIHIRAIGPGQNIEDKPISTPEEYVGFINDKLAHLKEQGFYRAYIVPRLTTISPQIGVDLYIYRGERNKISRVIKQGYKDLPDAYLEHNYGIYPGVLLSHTQEVRKNQGWKNDPLIDIYQEPDLLFYPDSTLMYFYSKKRKANKFDALMGISTAKGGRIQLNGYADIHLLNTFNKAEELRLYWKSNGNSRQDLYLKASFPYIFQSSLGVLGEMTMIRQDSSWYTFHLKGGLSFALNRKDQLQLKGLYEQSSTNVLQETMASYHKKGAEISWLRQGRSINELMGPSYNWNSNLWYSIRDDGKRTPQIGGSAEYSFVRNILTNHYIYASLEGYWAKLGDAVYDNELKRIGGFHSIRGFSEMQIATSSYGIGQLEYRYLSGKDLYLFSITDAAYYSNALIKREEWLVALGAGMCLNTRAGQFSMAWAMGKFQNESFNPGKAQIHFGYVSRF